VRHSTTSSRVFRPSCSYFSLGTSDRWLSYVFTSTSRSTYSPSQWATNLLVNSSENHRYRPSATPMAVNQQDSNCQLSIYFAEIISRSPVPRSARIKTGDCIYLMFHACTGDSLRDRNGYRARGFWVRLSLLFVDLNRSLNLWQKCDQHLQEALDVPVDSLVSISAPGGLRLVLKQIWISDWVRQASNYTLRKIHYYVQCIK